MIIEKEKINEHSKLLIYVEMGDGRWEMGDGKEHRTISNRND